MRKISVLLGVLLVMAGLLTNYLFEFDKDVEESDYNIAMMHSQKVYVEDDYDEIDVIIRDETDGEFIYYDCYVDGKFVYNTRIYRDAGYKCLTGYYDSVHD